MTKEIYFAGGCFWGVEAYFAQIKGVIKTEVGYAQGHVKNPTYKEVCAQTTGHSEACYIEYDNQVITLETLLEHLFRIIDPTSLNKQGGDMGEQYRTGVYYKDPLDETIIRSFITKQQANYNKEIVVEVQPFDSFYLAEEYHQDYLVKNPTGYCHVNLGLVKPSEKK